MEQQLPMSGGQRPTGARAGRASGTRCGNVRGRKHLVSHKELRASVAQSAPRSREAKLHRFAMTIVEGGYEAIRESLPKLHR
jgi:hypothetical protein